MLDSSNIFHAKAYGTDFWVSDLKDKKTYIEEALKEYTVTQLQIIDKLPANHQEATLIDLLKIVNGYLITKKDREEFYKNYTFYIINTASNLQNFQILWWIDEKESQPIAKFNEHGEWDALVTNPDDDPLTVTEYTLSTFNRQFQIDHNPLRQRIN